MKLAITTTAPPLTAVDVRRGLDDSAALARMARVWRLEIRGGRVVGKRGPRLAFSAEATCRR